MGGQNFIGGIITMIIIFLVISFAITLLPYILLGIVVWYFYRKLIRPLFGQTNQQAYKEKNYYATDVDKEEAPVVNQVKSVHDDTFFRQDHKVVDVDYDDEDK
ncbi:hypothetical protein [Proteiniclasticum sp.]|uniref:hypothetical protein n=1 Tax=Proteiniclasticum sp. TaxID=2053595 RepID=UPI002896E79F|nr:hypothetical protein [Proteiniclasticum sp.]